MFRRTALALTLVATAGLTLSAPAEAASSTSTAPSGFLKASDFPTEPFTWRRVAPPSPEEEQSCLDAAGSWGGDGFETRAYANDGDGQALQVNGRAERRTYAKNLVASANDSVRSCLREARETDALVGKVRRTNTTRGDGVIRTFRLTCPHPEEVGGCGIDTHIVGVARAGRKVVYVHIGTLGSISARDGRALADLAVKRALRPAS